VDSSNDWLSRLANALGSSERLGPVEGLAGNAWKVLVHGEPVVAKVGPGVADEAEGLRRLGQIAAGPPVPDVVLLDGDLLVTTWVEQSHRAPAHEEQLGRALAGLHAISCDGWGGGSGWIGGCPVDPRPMPTAAEFYRGRLSDLARRCGLAPSVEPVVNRLGDLLPAGGPALVHGDLWWGNVLWGADGQAWLVDPSVHGGHGEEDLAMLALFGPVPGRLLGAYCEINPLSEGWEQRIELFQLYPLLVHAVLFGGRYRSQAQSIARRYA
jgi:fructosamine-3-kinase